MSGARAVALVVALIGCRREDVPVRGPPAAHAQRPADDAGSPAPPRPPSPARRPAPPGAPAQPGPAAPIARERAADVTSLTRAVQTFDGRVRSFAVGELDQARRHAIEVLRSLADVIGVIPGALPETLRAAERVRAAADGFAGPRRDARRDAARTRAALEEAVAAFEALRLTHRRLAGAEVYIEWMRYGAANIAPDVPFRHQHPTIVRAFELSVPAVRFVAERMASAPRD